MIIAAALLLLGVNDNQKNKENPIEKSFSKHWSVKMGNTTYRTDVAFVNGQLILGSNGENYQDYLLDEGNGMYIINATNGKVKKNFLNESYGDMDINGVLFYENRIYTGNDNDEFICTDLDGEIIYRLPVSGDIEHSPMLIKNGNQNTIVYATESGEVTAVNPRDGKKIWTYYHKDFKGWKPGDNRFIFQVKTTYIKSGDFFFAKPGLADLNKDGVLDLIYYVKWNETIAINGKTGAELWSYIESNKSDIHFSYRDSPIVTGSGDGIRILKISYEYGDIENTRKLLSYDRKGKLLKTFSYNVAIGATGLNTLDTKNQLIIPFDNGVGVYDKVSDKITFITGLYTLYPSDYNQGTSNRLSTEPIIADKIFEYKGEQCVLVMHQRDNNSDSKASVSIIGLKSKKNLKTMHLPETSEFKPLIEDFTNDGKLDLLVNCRDGVLYCYDLNIPKSNLTLNQ